MDNSEERRRDLGTSLKVVYARITKILARLTLPIVIPSLETLEYQDQVEEALFRAYKVLNDVPMDEDAKKLIRKLIIEWAMASQAMAADDEEPDSARLDMIDLQRYRMYRILLMLDRLPRE